MILSPSLLSADCGNLAETLRNLESAGVKWVHWDVMDGQFVPNITFGQHVIKGLRPASGLFFDVHLMIERPERYLSEFRDAGADMLVAHVEATVHLQRTLAEIRRLGMKAGAALNPATPLSALDYVLDDVDMVLVMSVNPGFGGQKFLPATLRKVAELRAKLNAAGRADCLIQVDGGVNLDNTGALVEAGADVLVSGSAFFGHPPFSERLAAFTAAAR
ncbi:ribulose-phosphate 3-epimerase [uncultured Mailhella sp.]|uniref:ribulose-phosphate 3-epimerase n=1 Tax=uncultured Mailhella sp. TaxID=1981031 RepID=UPI0025D0D29A|nr:ribulose-phosphate 3-epimerase [uncultured Mailhella sp.]